MITRADFLKTLGTSIAGLSLATPLVKAAALAAQNTAPAAAPAPVAATVPAAAAAPATPHFVGYGSGFGNRIAITFDDGPTPGVTNIVLDELKRRNLRSTFFMIGQRCAAAPDLARRVRDEGHEICNHTFTHPKLNTLPDNRVDWELQMCQETIHKATDHVPVWLRPPYGAFRKNQAFMPAQKNLGVVLWSVDPRDWSQPGEDKIVGTILSEARPGSIILCHDLHKQTANCVGRVLDGLLEKGFEFTNISNFVGPAYAHTA
jgi:peptidoglycan/xylan/chitin deacetylase (PgdA/CDA1 family)